MADEELDRTGELLIEAGLITEEEIAKAAEDAGGSDSRILDAVRKSGHPRRSELAAFLAMDYAIQEISLPGSSIPKEVLKLVPEDFARKHVLVPVAVLGKSVLVIARPNIFNRAAVIALRKMTGLKVAVLRAAESEVESAINAGYLGMPWPKAAPKPPAARSAEAAALAVPVAGKTPGFETAHFPTLRPDELSPTGRETAKDWKRSIKHHGKSLKVLIAKGILTTSPSRCRCGQCQPVRISSRSSHSLFRSQV